MHAFLFRKKDLSVPFSLSTAHVHFSASFSLPSLLHDYNFSYSYAGFFILLSLHEEEGIFFDYQTYSRT